MIDDRVGPDPRRLAWPLYAAGLLMASLIWLAIASWRAGRASHRARQPSAPLIRDAKA